MADPNLDFNPAFGDQLGKMREYLHSQGIETNIISGRRSAEDQQQLVANAEADRLGKPLPYPARGHVPMAAAVGQSPHQFGFAADVEAVNPADQPKVWEATKRFGLQAIGASDPNHIQLPNWRTAMRGPQTGPPATPGTPTPATAGPTYSSGAPYGSVADHVKFIYNYAKSIGLDTNQALAIADKEGLRAWSSQNPNAASYVDVSGGKPFSFGDFQLNINPGAMGAKALAAGVDPRDPAQWQAADKYALDQMKAGGVGPWKGDPAAKAILAGGKPPDMSSMLGKYSVDPNAPAVPAPAAAVASGAAAPAAGGTLPGFDKSASDLFTKGVGGLDKALGGKGLGQDQGGGPDDRPSPMIPGPGAEGVSPLLPLSRMTYGQTINSLANPLTWGSSPPSMPAPPSPYAGAGQTTPIGTSLNSLALLQSQPDPTFPGMNPYGYGGGEGGPYGYGGYYG